LNLNYNYQKNTKGVVLSIPMPGHHIGGSYFLLYVCDL